MDKEASVFLLGNVAKIKAHGRPLWRDRVAKEAQMYEFLWSISLLSQNCRNMAREIIKVDKIQY